MQAEDEGVVPPMADEDASPRVVHGSLYEYSKLVALIDSQTTSVQINGTDFAVQLQEADLVLSRPSVQDNRESCIAPLIHQHDEELAQSREELAAKDQEIRLLTQQVEDGGDDVDTEGLRLARALVRKGQLIKRIQKLEQSVTLRYCRTTSMITVKLPIGRYTMVPSLSSKPLLWDPTPANLVDERVMETVEEEVPVEELEKMMNDRSCDVDTPMKAETPVKATLETPGTPRKAALETPTKAAWETPVKHPLSPLDSARGSSKRKRQLGVGTTVHLSNLPFVSTEDDVQSWFEGCGEIVRVLLPIFADSKKRRGYGFVEFISPDAAAKALELDGLLQHNRVVRVNLANAPTKCSRPSK